MTTEPMRTVNLGQVGKIVEENFENYSCKSWVTPEGRSVVTIHLKVRDGEFIEGEKYSGSDPTIMSGVAIVTYYPEKDKLAFHLTNAGPNKEAKSTLENMANAIKGKFTETNPDINFEYVTV